MKKINNIDRIVKIIKDVKKPSKKETKLKVNPYKEMEYKIAKALLAQFKEDFEDPIQYNLISTNYKPNKYRIITGKVLLDGFAYLTTCAVFAFIITTVLVAWMG